MDARQTSEGPTQSDKHRDAANDLRELSRKLEQRVHLLEKTLSHITDFAYIFDRDGRFVYANQALLDLWGLALGETVGKNFFDLGYPDELAARLQQQIQQVFDTGQGLMDETPYTSPTEKYGYYEYIFSPAFAADGTVEIVIGSTRDITRRKKTEAAPRDSERLIRDFTRNIPGGSLNVLDKDLRYLFAQGEGLARMGLSIEKLIGKTLFELLPPKTLDSVAPYYQKILSGENLDFELEVGAHWFIVNAAPLKDENGRIHAIIALAQDITNRKLAEEALALAADRPELDRIGHHEP